MSDSTPILQAHNLTREIETESGRLTTVDDFTFDFERGRIYTILGPSGAGKSSLLRLLNRLDEPTSGRILFDGDDQKGISPCCLRKSIGYLFQTPHLFPETVADNLRFANDKIESDAIDELLALASIKPEIRDKKVDGLSVGERQRVTLARLLATDPKVILLDEPTSALDPTFTEQIEKAIRNTVAERGITALMVSHNPEQAVRMNGDGLLLVSGKLIEHGPVRELVENPQTEDGRKYRDRELS